jgi:anthraniloyl-CoA monooxygenase
MGGAGLVFGEMTNVSPEGRISHNCVGMYRPEHQEAWRRIVDFVHTQSSAKIALQLGHAGRKGSTRRAPDGRNLPLEDEGWELLSASAIAWSARSSVPREADRADMDKVVGDYVRAARMGLAAGFDLLELHMAHGYLLSSFISPLSNRRGDAYGGSLKNRMRFPLEVLAAVRAEWPAEKPLSVRISAYDWLPEGLGLDEAVALTAMLKSAGCDIVTVSSGHTSSGVGAGPDHGRLYQAPFSDRIRNEVGIATIAVGTIFSWGDVNAMLAAGRADLCALGRGHLYDPYFTRHAALAQGYTLPWPSSYRTAALFKPHGVG